VPRLSQTKDNIARATFNFLVTYRFFGHFASRDDIGVNAEAGVNTLSEDVPYRMQ
jgi:hypothetical protein